uniref:Fatty acid hydroxylase domain-containing protein n=1 Tax=Alexandrium catenella TaxID=2925 RepID=A0A7S1RL96_ALECA|mmetsp:Transcript_6153/g.16394  ORF Transcript_6153/g.16394 Transcript_6153/m.16394 type:complete len:530 (+) Transcript_6153:66-1655(+)
MEEPAAHVEPAAPTEGEVAAATMRERKGRSRAESPAPTVAKKEPAAAEPSAASSGEAKAKKDSGFFEGFAGTTNGSFFKAPLWVDLRRPAGATSQESEVRSKPDLKSYLTGGNVFWSPNLVWLWITLLNYWIFPYDLVSAKTWSAHWVAYRLLANTLITFGYVGFWHVTLYILGWGKRPFNPLRKYRRSKVLHNMFYNVLGVVQWTLWEAIFMNCYATGRMPYITDEESFGTGWGFALFVLTWFWVVLWRDLHFYFAHRFLHVKFLYKYVHSLHHRNTDVEPFAGLCMHPVEHMFYFACAGPCLYVKASPFALMWMGIHMLISPAASHSGFEDNWQSDQFHYAHHRFFECNYGTSGVPYDLWFGTFRDSLDVKSQTYRGEHVESKDVKLDLASAAQADAKATLAGVPRWDEAAYNLLSYVICPLLVASSVLSLVREVPHWLLADPHALAFIMSVGPLVIGAVLLALSSRRPFATPRITFLYPFHKEKWLGAFGLNVVISLSVTVLPVYHLVHMLVSEPGNGIYYTLYGK